jgi:hypothetical protein
MARVVGEAVNVQHGCAGSPPQYAGNVIVFSRGKQYHGDWFGGVNAGNAAAFLDALLKCTVGAGWQEACASTALGCHRCVGKPAVSSDDCCLAARPHPQAPSGPPGDYALRSWWRGRIGLTKEQQHECFKKGLRDIEELGGGSLVIE